MAREDVELVRRGFDLWAQGGPEAAQDFLWPHCAPDFEYVLHLAQLEGKPYRGPEGLTTSVSDMLEAFEEVRPEARIVRPRTMTCSPRSRSSSGGLNHGITHCCSEN